VEHPKLFEPGDPVVERVRALCLRLPETAEIEAWGRPTFRVGKRVFAVAGASMDRPHTMVFKPDPEERLALVEDPRFFSPPYFGPAGWLALGLDLAATDWEEVGELAETSYRQVALKRQVRLLDEVGPHARR
jgi:predicted DNA-binding protein (MmcQ/YjbR family)